MITVQEIRLEALWACLMVGTGVPLQMKVSYAVDLARWMIEQEDRDLALKAVRKAVEVRTGGMTPGDLTNRAKALYRFARSPLPPPPSGSTAGRGRGKRAGPGKPEGS